METFGERLKTIRKYLNFSQKKLATELGVSTSYIGLVETGNHQPSYNLIMKIISKYPMVNVDWLLKGNEEMLKKGLNV